MKRAFTLVLALCILLSVSICAGASGAKQHDYSETANSGIRHQVCTSLLGTSASDYYAGDYSYTALSALSGESLLDALRDLLTDTHRYKSTYGDCRDLAVKTDCENADGVSVNLIYCSYSATWDDWCNNRSSGWNREHVWPKALGGFDTEGPGADLHHIRPSDQPLNNTRGNKLYGNVSGGKDATGAAYTGRLVGGQYNGTYFEPLDNAKGDIARICLYVYTRYGGSYSKCSDITNVFESVDVLLEWCALDPVDTWEMGRNEVVGKIQGNRNVFIDYPELAWLLFDRDIPQSMTTPSGEASHAPAPCSHSQTELRGRKNATCTADGYTGDTYCADCGKRIASGSAVKATGHKNEDNDNLCDRCGASVTCGHGATRLENASDANCQENGYTGDTLCSHCGKILESGEVIPATGAHCFGDWMTVTEAQVGIPGRQERTCTVCGSVEASQIPALDPPATQPTVTQPSTPAETQPTAPSETSPAGSGDRDSGDRPDIVWAAVLIAAAGGCCVIVFIAIRKAF